MYIYLDVTTTLYMCMYSKSRKSKIGNNSTSLTVYLSHVLHFTFTFKITSEVPTYHNIAKCIKIIPYTIPMLDIRVH